MKQITREEKLEMIADMAGDHVEKVAFTEQVMGLRGVFALGAPPVFEEIIADLEAEVEASSQAGFDMLASLDGPLN